MRFMRIKEVIECTGLGRTSLHKLVKMGLFPQPVPLVGRAKGYVSDEVNSWIQDRIKERDSQLDILGNTKTTKDFE